MKPFRISLMSYFALLLIFLLMSYNKKPQSMPAEAATKSETITVAKLIEAIEQTPHKMKADMKYTAKAKQLSNPTYPVTER